MIARYKCQKSKTSVLSHGFHVQMQDFFGERKRVATPQETNIVEYYMVQLKCFMVEYYIIQFNPTYQLSDGR